MSDLYHPPCTQDLNLGLSMSTRLHRRQSSTQLHCHDDEIDEGRQGFRPTQSTPFHDGREGDASEKVDESAQGDEIDEGREG